MEKPPYKKDKRLYNLLNNKRVALIGPSKHLEGKKCGKRFEEYDLICRVNEFYPYEQEEDYGNRTDIVFHNINMNAAPVLKNELTRHYNKTVNLKFIVCPQRGSDDRGEDIIGNFKKLNIYDIPFHHIGDPFYYYVRYNTIGTKPNTGIMSIITLLNYNMKELLLSGFSFYHQGKTMKQCHRKGYPSQSYVKYTTGHQQQPQIDFFKRLMKFDEKEKIIVDSYMNEIFDLKKKNVFELD